MKKYFLFQVPSKIREQGQFDEAQNLDGVTINHPGSKQNQQFEVIKEVNNHAKQPAQSMSRLRNQQAVTEAEQEQAQLVYAQEQLKQQKLSERQLLFNQQQLAQPVEQVYDSEAAFVLSQQVAHQKQAPLSLQEEFESDMESEEEVEEEEEFAGIDVNQPVVNPTRSSPYVPTRSVENSDEESGSSSHHGHQKRKAGRKRNSFHFSSNDYVRKGNISKNGYVTWGW